MDGSTAARLTPRPPPPTIPFPLRTPLPYVWSARTWHVEANREDQIRYFGPHALPCLQAVRHSV
jgi:hypothetical protein